jgi:hypothetical protein
MPLDVLGCTRATLMPPTSFAWLKNPANLVKRCRDGICRLSLFVTNEEFLVTASHQLAVNTSLPFVHTARRSYRLNAPVNTPDTLLSAGKLVKS